MRFFLNLLISSGMLLLFRWFGWLQFDPSLENLAVILLVLIAISMVYVVIVLVLSIITALFAVTSDSIAPIVSLVIAIIIIVPLYSWIALNLAAGWTGRFEIVIPFMWQGLVMSILFGLIRIPSATVSRSK